MKEFEGNGFALAKDSLAKTKWKSGQHQELK
jgi:hypothetical protein